MSQIWVFSPISEQKLRDCIAAASPVANNKWLQHFRRNCEQNYNLSNDVVETIQKPAEIIENTSTEDVLETYDDFFDTIEADTLLKIDYIIEECMKNNKLLGTIAERLSSNCLEKICTNILNKKDIDEPFIDIFFKYFIPTFLKREQSLFNLDLLVQAKGHSRFKNLINNLLLDLEVPNKLLQDFVMTLNEEEKTDFISNIVLIDLPCKNLIYNIFTIYIAYKDCIKSDIIQNYMMVKLKETGQHCTTERHYGRLFLTFLQAEKARGHYLDESVFRDLIEIHKTPFKRPCMNVLNEIIEINSSK